MSKYVEVRGVKIGEGVPKICVPIVGKTKEEILAAARSFEDVALDVVEWRVDWFEGVFAFVRHLAKLRFFSHSVLPKKAAKKQSKLTHMQS